MQQIDVMVDGITSLPAEQFNQPMRELENAIQAYGQTLSESDLYQISKSLTSSVSYGDYYIDSGTANAYILNPENSARELPDTLEIGTRVRFVPQNINTGNCTLKLGSYSAIPMSTEYVEDGGTPTVLSDVINPENVTEATYQKTPDGETEYWRLSTISLSLLTDGVTSISITAAADYRLQLRPTEIEFNNDTDGAFSGMSSLSIVNTSSSGNVVTTQNGITEYWDGTNDIKTGPRGIRYDGNGASDLPETNSNYAVIDMTSSGKTWTLSNGYWVASSITSGIPKACLILGSTVTYTMDSVAGTVVSSIILNGGNNPTFHDFGLSIPAYNTSAGFAPVITNMYITVHYDGTNLP